MFRPALLIAFAAALVGCNAGEVGDTPIERCVPEGSCDEAMFRSGLSAAQGNAAAGAALYAKECARCHGEGGKGVAEARRIDMTSPAWQATMRDGTIVKTLRAGRPPVMPAFQFSDEALKDILAHLRTLQVAPAATTRKGY